MTLILTHPAGNQKVWTHEGHQYFEIAQVDETTSIYESEPGMSIQIEEVVFVGLFRKLYFDYHKSYMYLVVSNGLVYTLQDALQQGIITEDQALNTVPDLKAVYLED